MNIRNQIIILSFILLLAACQQSNQKGENKQTEASTTQASNTNSKQNAIQPPVPKLVKPPVQFSIDAGEAHELETPKGSKIIIPANAFCDANGKPIEGKVDIQFEEFHDAADIILSGIPMQIETENGSMETLESAGMFRINGTAQGKEVRIANGKELEIQLASYETGDDYNFYELEESSGSWTEKGRTAPVANASYETALSKLGPEPIQPVAIKKAASNDLVFNLAVNKTSNPEFSYFDNVMWKLAEGEAENKLLFESEVRNPDLKCVDANRSIFTLSGSVGNGKIKTRVQPVLFGSNWKKAQEKFKSKMSQYKKAKQERDSKMVELNDYAKVTRSFSLARFGTYNFDRIMKLKRRVQFQALFFVPALQKLLKSGFLIEKKNKSLIPYHSGGSNVFMFDPRERNVVIALDEDGYVYEFPEAQFSDIMKRELDATTKYQFTMKETGIQIDDHAELRDYIDRL